MPPSKYFYVSQRNWINDNSPLKILVKSRQTGFSWCNSYRLVRLVSARGARLDAYIVSRDLNQAALTLEDCRNWAAFMKIGCTDLGEILFDRDSNSSAYVLQFANGRRIYCLSSNPNALAGKRGHVTLDEFALHPDQRLLYRVAKPVTTWGGQLSIISTHRGHATLFNQIINSIKHPNSHLNLNRNASLNPDLSPSLNPFAAPTPTLTPTPIPPTHSLTNSLAHSFASWSLHEVPIQKAVDEGIVERINKKTGRNESREAFLLRLRAECIDEEQWLQEYCCIPADENAAFFSYELLDSCTDPHLQLLDFSQLQQHLQDSKPETQNSQLFLGVDLARKRNLCVLDLAEKVGSVFYDRLRIELHDQPFSQIESSLYPILRLPQLKRACIDASGLGIQLAEQARQRFGWKVEPITFTSALKEELAFALRHDFEDLRLRIPRDDLLRADLRALKKEISPSGKLRFIGDTDDGHCDRTWAKALRQHAARPRHEMGALVC